jgi:hypothetical protein
VPRKHGDAWHPNGCLDSVCGVVWQMAQDDSRIPQSAREITQVALANSRSLGIPPGRLVQISLHERRFCQGAGQPVTLRIGGGIEPCDADAANICGRVECRRSIAARNRKGGGIDPGPVAFGVRFVGRRISLVGAIEVGRVVGFEP